MSKLVKAAQEALFTLEDVEDNSIQNWHRINVTTVNLKQALKSEPDWPKLVREYRDAERARSITESGSALGDNYFVARTAELKAKTALFAASQEDE